MCDQNKSSQSGQEGLKIRFWGTNQIRAQCEQGLRVLSTSDGKMEHVTDGWPVGCSVVPNQGGTSARTMSFEQQPKDRSQIRTGLIPLRSDEDFRHPQGTLWFRHLIMKPPGHLESNWEAIQNPLGAPQDPPEGTASPPQTDSRYAEDNGSETTIKSKSKNGKIYTCIQQSSRELATRDKNAPRPFCRRPRI